MPSPRFHLYLSVVTAAGLATLAAVALTGADTIGDAVDLELALFGAFFMLGELLAIRFPGREGEITTSTTFAFAALLTHGIAAAALVQALGCALSDLAQRRPPLKSAFNVAQYTLSLVASGAVLHHVAGTFDTGDPVAHMPAVAAAAGTYFIFNNTLVGIASALASDEPLLAHIRSDLAFQASMALILLALAPIVVVTTDRALALLPLLGLAIAAVYKGGREASINEHRALHDSLTELPNREGFRRALREWITGGRGAAAVLVLDLDRFKEINNTLGHECGDRVVEQVATRLGSAVRPGDVLARLGGDEFGVFVPGASRADAAALAERLADAVATPIDTDGIRLEVSASSGIACFPSHATDPDGLIRRADVALSLAKAAHTPVATYAPERDEHSAERLTLLGELRRAIHDGELVLRYQPKVDAITFEPVGCEALVRWRHPVRGLLGPGEFLPLAEHTALIHPLTRYVLTAAIRDAAAWRRAGRDFGVSVNLSARNLDDPELPLLVAELLADSMLDSAGLTLEITESAVVSDPASARSVMEELSAIGVRCSIDDFGTGYSSLEYLKHLPVDELKVDRSFAAGIASDAHDAAIVKATIDMAHALGLTVVAEGVESDEVFRALGLMGCDHIQGFLIAEPVAAHQLAATLDDWASRRPAASSESSL